MSDQATLTRAERRSQPIPLTDAEHALVTEITTRLNESFPQAIRQIQALVHFCGIDLARQTLTDVLTIEGEGGLLNQAGTQRRTPGGVFLFLMSQRITQTQKRDTIYLYQNPKNKPKKNNAPRQQQPPKSKLPPPAWDIYRDYLAELLAQRGTAPTVKITVIGRPGAVSIQEETVITTVEGFPKLAALPKGVPTPPRAATLYTLYIGVKQWRRVERALMVDETDAMIIEGTCAFDPELPGMVVYATTATTKRLESAKRDAKAAVRPAEDPAPVASGTVSAVATAAPSSKYPIPTTMPPTAAQKLHDLYSAAEQFRQKLAALELKPAEERLGYAMTQKLLKNTEDQISALEKQYK
ncbi:MAG: hypothetical protein H7Y11_08015 [Armatimonadetes bacterium]|nr:hypothetical protein [Anaerolineae bacterium]